MKNHKLLNDKCMRCGITRKIVKDRILMAVMNHPPWNCYKYTREMHYYRNGNHLLARPICN